MASGADQFLSSFNRIEKRLRDELDNPRNMGFSEMVRRLQKSRLRTAMGLSLFLMRRKKLLSLTTVH